MTTAKETIWINSAANTEGVSIFNYVETPTLENVPIGTISAQEGHRPTWRTDSSSGNADSIGHAKRAVELLSKIK